MLKNRESKSLKLSIFTGLWGLILAKCYILEYCVRVYAVPINSTLYIWSLSLLMASVASYILWTLTTAERRQTSITAQSNRRTQRIAATGIAAALITLAAGWTVPALIDQALQPGFALILSACYLAIGFSERNNWLISGGLTWLFGMLVLLWAPQTLGLFLFGCFIVLLVVMPACLQLAHNWQAKDKMELQC